MVLARMIRVIGWKRDRHVCYRAIDGSLLVILECVGMRSLKQDGVERTINAVDGIVMRVIGRCFSGSLKVVAKATEAFAYLDGGALQQGLFKLPGIGLVIMGLGDGLLQQYLRILVAGGS
ncbi:hypothetical protein HR52_10835 [Aeromonas hydrophila]|nr:hypothetical protein HR52_10835 [Aeromonas hydrophila]OCA65469.1 hypothetical protein A9R12_12530 [Aeromonas hydrophila]OCY06678.1 hypothetical protein A9X69_10885 [Aeromonas hydrophila]